MSKAKKTRFELAVIERVIEKRRQLGLTQEYIAEVLGLTQGFVGQIESPKSASKYNLNHLNRLAEEMGCSPREFLPDNAVREDA